MAKFSLDPPQTPLTPKVNLEEIKESHEESLPSEKRVGTSKFKLSNPPLKQKKVNSTKNPQTNS